jgi:hypothetical protein
MAYVGTPLDTTNAFQSLAGKRFNGDASTTAFTLDSAPNSTLDIEVFIENVRQDPNSAYTVSGTTLTFTSAPPSGTNNIYVVHQAKAVGTIDPAVGSTLDLNGAAELILDADADTTIAADTDDQIDFKVGGTDVVTLTNSSLVLKGTTPTITVGDAGAEDTKIVFDGNAQDYHIGLDDSADDLVIGLGSALGTTTHMSFDETGAIIKPLQPAARVTLSGNLSVNHNTFTKVSFDTETYDKNGDFASNKFTAPVAGRYFIHCHAEIMDLADQKDFLVCIYKNGSITNSANEKSSSANYQTNSITDVLELAATDYIEFYVKHVHGSSRDIYSANTFGEVYLLG